MLRSKAKTIAPAIRQAPGPRHARAASASAQPVRRGTSQPQPRRQWLRRSRERGGGAAPTPVAASDPPPDSPRGGKVAAVAMTKGKDERAQSDDQHGAGKSRVGLRQHARRREEEDEN